MVKAIIWRVLTLRYEGVGMKGIRYPCSPRCNDGRSMWKLGDAMMPTCFEIVFNSYIGAVLIYNNIKAGRHCLIRRFSVFKLSVKCPAGKYDRRLKLKGIEETCTRGGTVV